jgi:competence protein ComGC
MCSVTERRCGITGRGVISMLLLTVIPRSVSDEESPSLLTGEEKCVKMFEN